jgi:APA family basic amino acid/polyamine antiporter
VPFAPAGWSGVWEAAALLFGAYAGYARIATLSEEVVDPRRTLPRAIGLALGGSALLYLLVAVAALALVDAPTLARSAAPLADALRARQIAWAPSVLAAGALVATASVFLTLLTGTSRVFFAMARNGDLPRPLAALDPSAHTPRAAVLASGIVVAVLALTGDLRALIEAGSAAILFYYALTNAAALRLAPAQRGFPAALAVLGLLACLTLMAALPAATLLRFALVLGVGLAGYAAKRWLTRRARAA